MLSEVEMCLTVYTNYINHNIVAFLGEQSHCRFKSPDVQDGHGAHPALDSFGGQDKIDLKLVELISLWSLLMLPQIGSVAIGHLKLGRSRG